MAVRATEISDLLKQQIQGFSDTATVSNVGQVIAVGDGVATVHGLSQAMQSELVEFTKDGTLGLVLNLETYQAAMLGKPLDLTYMEYELLKFLAQNPGKVFTREMLLNRVWGYEYYGGARTVDVHVRRLRAKLGTEHEALIGTVRNVGYKFVRPSRGGLGAPSSSITWRGASSFFCRRSRSS